MEMTYLKQPPKSYTFEQPKLKRFVEKQCKGKVLNLFAGKTKLRVNEVRNDLDEDMPADYHKDALDFVNEWNGNDFDTVILDPPYNVRKAREKYNGKYQGKMNAIKDALLDIISEGAIVITLGYSTGGMSKKRGFEKKEIAVVYHGGDHDDTLVTVEKRVPTLNGFHD